MTIEVLVLFIVFSALALFELDQIRKDTKQIRIMMETEQSARLAACTRLDSISRMLEAEIVNGRERRMRDSLAQ